MGDPFRGDDNAALLRAARLEEENERLRKELEEAKHPKPLEKKTKPAQRERPRVTTFVLAALVVSLVVVAVVLAATGRTRAERMRDARLAKTLDPSPSITATATAKRTPEWIEDKHVTEIDIRAVTHGVTPPVNYAVGAGGTILRRYGATWALEASGTTSDLHGVAEQLGKVCAVGDGGVATCALDPSKPTWKLEKTGTTSDLLALTQSYGLLAVGRKGTIVRREGDAWKREESGTKEDLFGVANGYAVGAHGTILEDGDKGWH
ncbi:MAG TPA: hypothetical protein VGH87_12770, partial [Polyangiaceae bacterium]